MKNVVFREYFACFEGIWQTKCIKDEEVDKLSVEDRAKDRENTDESDNDDEEENQWRWRGIPMMKRSIEDYNEEQVKREEGDDEEEEWKSISRWIHANKRSMMTC